MTINVNANTISVGRDFNITESGDVYKEIDEDESLTVVQKEEVKQLIKELEEEVKTGRDESKIKKIFKKIGEISSNILTLVASKSLAKLLFPGMI